jgi:hypothetical protein
MSITLYKASVPTFVHYLTVLTNLLDRACAFADAKKIDTSVLTAMRLAPDMHPLAFQVRTAADFAVRACATISGVKGPELGTSQTSIAQLKERTARAIEFAKSIKPDQLDGRDDDVLDVSLGGQAYKFTGLSFLMEMCLPNFFFHVTTAYDILRHAGVDLGKRDFMGLRAG